MFDTLTPDEIAQMRAEVEKFTFEDRKRFSSLIDAYEERESRRTAIELRNETIAELADEVREFGATFKGKKTSERFEAFATAIEALAK